MRHATAGDDGNSAGICLQNHNSETLDGRWKHQAATRVEQRQLLIICDFESKFDAVSETELINEPPQFCLVPEIIVISSQYESSRRHCSYNVRHCAYGVIRALVPTELT